MPAHIPSPGIFHKVADGPLQRKLKHIKSLRLGREKCASLAHGLASKLYPIACWNLIMTVIYVLNLKLTQTWQKVVDTGFRKDKNNTHWEKTYLFKQKCNLFLLFLIYYLPLKVSIKPTNGIVASCLDSLVHNRPTRSFGSGGGARASFQRVTYKKKNYIYVLYVGLTVLTFDETSSFLFFVFG